MGPVQTIAGVGAGFDIGVIAAFLGVAGGELLPPTLVLLFAYALQPRSRLCRPRQAPAIRVRHGTRIDCRDVPRWAALGVIPASLLLPLLAAILVLSAVKLWRHR